MVIERLLTVADYGVFVKALPPETTTPELMHVRYVMATHPSLRHVRYMRKLLKAIGHTPLPAH